MKGNYDKIAKIEQAIKAKYGEDAVKNPMSEWSKEKEEDYIRQIKDCAKQENAAPETQKQYCDGFFVNKKLLNKESNRVCPVCDEYTFDLRDDVYLNKWQSCHKCYVKWIEDREDRWKSGWRPGD
jgi:hypothetical protein